MSRAPKGRVCLVSSNFPRWDGDDTTPFVLHLAADLQKLGWQIDVLAPHAPGAAHEERLEGVAVYRFPYWWPRSGETVCYGGGALINLRQRRSNWLKLPALIGAEYASVVRKLRAREYDVLHSHWVLPQGFVGSLATRSLVVPHVVTVHGGDVFGLRGGMLERAKRYAFEHADVVTANSSVTESLVRKIAPSASVRRIPMGITVTEPPAEPAPATLRASYRRGSGPMLAFVGRLVEEKGVGDLIRALAYLGPDATAVIAGSGPDRQAFEELARELGIADRVFFVGWVEPDQVPAYLRAADVFVGPSKRAADGWMEAQGLSFAEAMLAGVPVVATRSGGIADVVQDEETGLLVSEGSPEEIAAAVERMIREPGLAHKVRRTGYERVRTRFTREATAEAFDRLFEQLRRSPRDTACI